MNPVNSVYSSDFQARNGLFLGFFAVSWPRMYCIFPVRRFNQPVRTVDGLLLSMDTLKEVEDMAKAPPGTQKPLTKTQIMAALAESTGMSKKDVQVVIDALTEEIRGALSSKGAGMFTIPGLIKITKKNVPARKAQKNVYNPLKGEHEDRAAKPASVKVQVRALKALKDMV